MRRKSRSGILFLLIFLIFAINTAQASSASMSYIPVTVKSSESTREAAPSSSESPSEEPSTSSEPLTVNVIDNKSFLDLGHGLQYELSSQYSENLNGSLLYREEVLRGIPVPLIVSFKNWSSREKIIREIGRYGGAVNLTYTELPFLAATLPAENVSLIADSDISISLSVNSRVKTCLNESVPLIKPSADWSSLEQQVGYAINGTGIRIAIIDTGINQTHPDFSFPNGTSKIIFSTSVVPGEDTRDYYGHGTHVAGIAAGTGAASNYTLVGVAPGAALYNIKVMSRDGWGYTSWIIAGIEFAVNHTADVINLSLGADDNTDGTDPISAACDWAVDQGVTVVVAAGNAGLGSFKVGTPACARKVITVGASSKQNDIAFFSSGGPTFDFRIKPDVVAPGVDIVAPASVGSTIWASLSKQEIVGNWYCMLSGTSMASPHVAGVAALLKEVHPDWDPQTIKAALMNTASDLKCSPFYQGAGQVNAYSAAVASILAVSPSVSFGFTTPGSYFANTTLLSISNTTQVITNAKLTTKQISNNAEKKYVSMNLTTPATILAGEQIGVNLSLVLPSNAPEDLYGGVLTINSTGTPLRVPYVFVYKAVVSVSVVKGGRPISASISLYGLPDAAPRYSSIVTTQAKFLVSSGRTYVVHAIHGWIDGESSSLYYSMFLLTAKVTVSKGTLNYVTLDLDSARRIAVANSSRDGGAFSSSSSDRQLYYYFKNYVSGLTTVGAGRPDYLFLSDTTETIFFNLVAYVKGTEPNQSDVEAANYRTSRDFYDLNWKFSGVNASAPQSLTYAESDLTTYTFNYESNGGNISATPGYWGGTINQPIETSAHAAYYPVSAPNSTSVVSSVYEVFRGVQRHYHVKYVEGTEHWAAYLSLYGKNGYEFVAKLSFPAANSTITFASPPYRLNFSINNSGGTTAVNLPIFVAAQSGYVKLHSDALSTTLTAYRNGAQISVSATSDVTKNYPFTEVFNGTATFDSSASQKSVYLVDAILNTQLQLWRKTEVTAQFTKPSSDVNPPQISDLQMSPTFDSSSILPLSFLCGDDNEVLNATAWYSSDNGTTWHLGSLDRSGNRFSGNLSWTGSPQYISLRIKVFDAAGNYMQYTIIPISVRKHDIRIVAGDIPVNPGSSTPIEASISNALISPVALQFYANNSFIGNYVVKNGSAENLLYTPPSTIKRVNLGFRLELSADYSNSSSTTLMSLDEAWAAAEHRAANYAETLSEAMSSAHVPYSDLAKAESDSLSPIDVLSKETGKAFGDISSVIDGSIRGFAKFLFEGLTSTYDLSSSAAKVMSDSLSPVEAVSKDVGKALGDATSVIDGSLRGFVKFLSEEVASTYGLSNYAAKIMSDSFSPVGVLSRETGKILGDISSMVDNSVTGFVRFLFEGIGSTYDLSTSTAKSQSDSASLIDALSRATGKSLGDISAVIDGSVRSFVKFLSEGAASTSDLSNRATKAVFDPLSPVGVLSSGTSKLLGDISSVIDGSMRSFLRFLFEGVASTSGLSRNSAKSQSDSVSLVDAVSKETDKALTDMSGMIDGSAKSLVKFFSEGTVSTYELSNHVAKVVSDTLSPVEAVSKEVGKALGDVFAVVDWSVRSFVKFLSEEVASTYGLSSHTAKVVSDSFSPADALSRTTGKSLGDISAVIDGSVRSFVRFLSEGMVSTHDLSSSAAKIMSDSLSPVEAVSKDVGKALGDLSSVVDWSVRGFAKFLFENIGSAQDLSSNPAKSQSDSASLIDAVSKEVGRSLSDMSGVVDCSIRGFVRLLSDGVASTYDLSRNVSKVVSDSLSPVEAVSKEVGKALGDIYIVIDSSVRGFVRFLFEGVVSTSGLSRNSAKSQSDSVSLVDVISKDVGKALGDIASVVDGSLRGFARFLFEGLTVNDKTAVGQQVFVTIGNPSAVTSETPLSIDATQYAKTLITITNVSKPVTISVRNLAAPPTGSNITGPATIFRVVGSYIEINTTDRAVSVNATIRIDYTLEQLLSAGLDENTLSIQYWNSTLKEWVPVACYINREGHYVYANVNHFSYWALAAQPVPLWRQTWFQLSLVATLALAVVIAWIFGRSRRLTGKNLALFGEQS